jgi:CMP-N-acetylneuraminic acid synthetase
METTVFIPAKGNSVRVPGKNLIDWKGKPLLLWAIEYAQSEGFHPIVFTDCEKIAAYARKCGAGVLEEPEHLVPAKYMPVVKYLADHVKTNIVVLPAPTPERRPGMIREALKLLETHDSVYAGVRPPIDLLFDKRGRIVNRKMDPDGSPPLTQTTVNDPQWLETRSLYAVRYPEILETSGYIIFGRTAVVEVPWRDAVDIDHPEDLVKPTVVAVGNAENMKRRKLGWLIDSYDVVIRHSDHVTEGFEENVGTKMTHWAFPCRYVATMGIERDCSDLTEIWMRGFGEYYEEGFKKWNPKVKTLLELAPDLSILKPFEDPEWIQAPSTGMLSIINAMNRWGVLIDIAGFGSSEETIFGHYTSKKFSNCHDFARERLIINQWEKEGLVRRIDQ